MPADKQRFSSSPDSVRVQGGFADCMHPSASAFTVINHRCVLTTSRIHPFIFNALKACRGKDDITANFENFGVSAYPDLPTTDDLVWFGAHWTSDVGRVRELTCSGRVWKNIMIDERTACVISFWSDCEDVPDSTLHLILEALDLNAERPVYVEFMNSLVPLIVNNLAFPIRLSPVPPLDINQPIDTHGLP